MFSQMLNSRLHFGAPMFAPIVNNIVMIATALGFMYVAGSMATTDTITSGQVAWLGIGTTLGVAAQAAVLIPVLIRVGYRWRPRFDFRGHGLGKAGSLVYWTIGLVLVNQIGFLVISRLATQANFIAEQSGDVPQGLATYQRAFLVFMLPHSVITISLVTALFPRMSKSAAVGALRDVSHDVSEGIRLICALLVPCVMFLIAFGPMLGTVFFGFGANRGALYDVHRTCCLCIRDRDVAVRGLLHPAPRVVRGRGHPHPLHHYGDLQRDRHAADLLAVYHRAEQSCGVRVGACVRSGLLDHRRNCLDLAKSQARGLETGQTVGTVVRMMIAGFFAALVGLFAVAGWPCWRATPKSAMSTATSRQVS